MFFYSFSHIRLVWWLALWSHPGAFVCMFLWVFFRCSGFLPRSKHMHTRLTGNSYNLSAHRWKYEHVLLFVAIHQPCGIVKDWLHPLTSKDLKSSNFVAVVLCFLFSLTLCKGAGSHAANSSHCYWKSFIGTETDHLAYQHGFRLLYSDYNGPWVTAGYLCSSSYSKSLSLPLHHSFVNTTMMDGWPDHAEWLMLAVITYEGQQDFNLLN